MDTNKVSNLFNLKSHVSPHFNNPELRIVMVALTMLLASYDEYKPSQ